MTALSRRAFTAAATAAATLPFLPRVARAVASPRAAALYRRALVLDACGSPGGWATDVKDGERRMSPGQVDNLRASGVDLISVTVNNVGNRPDVYRGTIEEIAGWQAQMAARPDVFAHVRRSADVRAAKASGRTDLIFAFQDASILGGSVDAMRTFDDLGVRIMQPVYNRRNLMGDGCFEPANGGLSKLGQDLVADLNTRRIAVDLSHAGQRTQADGIAASKRPPLITHSGCRAIEDYPRNTYDAEMKALADRGGVMGLYFMPFLRSGSTQARASDLLAHIEHALRVMGGDHVGLGTDGPTGPYQMGDKIKADHRRFTDERIKAGNRVARRGIRGLSVHPRIQHASPLRDACR